MSNRRNFLAVLALMAGCAASTALAMGPAAVFVVDLLKQVAVSVMADLVKDSVKGSGSAPATSFEARWPQRKHVILSIDEIAVDPQRKFAFARYTIEFHVARAGDEKYGITRLMVAIGNFDSQPRIHAVREVVKHY